MQQEYASTLKQYEDATKAVDAAYAAYERNRLSLYREAAKEAESIIDRWEDELDEDEDYEPDEYFSD